MSVFRVGNKSTVNNFPNIRPTLDLDFANSKTLDPRIDFTRASGGSYVDINGIIKYAGVNEARFDHDPITGESLGLLIEESRANLIQRSEEFNNSYWIKEDSFVRLAPITSPDGKQNAFKFIESLDVNSSTHVLRISSNIIPFVSNEFYTFSIFVKPDEIDTIQMQFGVAAFGGSNPTARFLLKSKTIIFGGGGTSISAKITEHTNGWFRIQTTLRATSTSAAGISLYLWKGEIRNYVGNGASGIFIWGAQLEAGSFPTSYIPTQASARTRAADNAQITGKNFSNFYNQNEGSIFCKYDRIGLSSADTPWGLNDETNANSLRLVGGVNNNSQRRFDILFSNIPQTQLILSTTETTNTLYKVAVFYKNRDSAGSYDGGSLVRGTPPFIPVVNTLSIGRASLSSPSSIHNGHITRLTYYPKRLPDSNLQALTR